MQKQQICQLFSPHNEFISDISELTSTDVYKHCEITEEVLPKINEWWVEWEMGM